MEQLLPPTQPYSYKGFLTEGSIYTKKLYSRIEANKNLQRGAMPITQRENTSHYYLSSMGGSVATTKLLPAHPFPEDHLGSQIPGSSNGIEDNEQPPPLI